MESLHHSAQTAPRSLFKTYCLVLGIVVIWGLNWPVSKIGLSYISPYGLVAGRLIIGTIAMFVIVAAAGKLVWPRQRDLPIILVISFLQITLFMLFVNSGLHYVDAGRSAILVYSTPIWVIPMAIFFFDERVTLFQWIGFLFGLLGIMILFSPWAINWSDPHQVWGNIFLLLSALCWAVSMLCARHMEWTRSPFELMPWQLLFATVPITFLAWNTGALDTAQWNLTLVECLIYAGVLATSFGYWGAVVISKELPSSKASLSFLGVPVCGFFSSVILLHEPMTATSLIAILFILIGLIFVALNKQKI